MELPWFESVRQWRHEVILKNLGRMAKAFRGELLKLLKALSFYFRINFRKTDHPRTKWHHFQLIHVIQRLFFSLKFRPTEALVADHLRNILKKAHQPHWVTPFANVTKLPCQQSLDSGKTNVSGSFCCSAGWQWWRWTWITDHLGKSEWKFMRFSPWKLFSWVFCVCSAVSVVVQSRRKDLKSFRNLSPLQLA